MLQNDNDNSMLIKSLKFSIFWVFFSLLWSPSLSVFLFFCFLYFFSLLNFSNRFCRTLFLTSTFSQFFSFLSILEIPVKFTKKLEAVNAEIGGSVTLTCEVSHAKGKVVWRRNAVEIKPSKRFQIHEEGVRRTLTITGIRAEDEGEYFCESRDDKSSITITPKGMSLEMKGDSVEESLASLISHYNPTKLSLFMCLCCSLC